MEDSFHESGGSPPSGSWATVMVHDDVRFVIAALAPTLSARGLGLLVLALLGGACLAHRSTRFPKPAPER